MTVKQQKHVDSGRLLPPPRRYETIRQADEEKLERLSILWIRNNTMPHIDMHDRGSFWYEDTGQFRLLGGSTLAPQCEPHFHETHSIAFVRRGEARMCAGGIEIDLVPGMAVLLNPFEVASCISSDNFEYDVCYLPEDLMERIGHVLGSRPDQILRFRQPTLSGTTAAHLGAAVRPEINANSGQGRLQERQLVRFLVEHWNLFDDLPRVRSTGCASRAKDLIEELIDQPLSVNEISKRLRTSRSYFVRSFCSDVGLPPSSYIRQKRLSRGLDFLRGGLRIAQAALDSGFSDQAHFTREFKRFYGTTPGKLVRDLGRAQMLK